MSSSALYVVATPIGNLDDITFRAVKVLGEVDLVAAEDTRASRVLLERFGIKTPVYSCHKFNEEKRGAFFARKLLEGKSVALISDAGTPCISDPGHRLVKLAHESGIDVVSVCGASSVTAALSVSGFPADSFTFIGFLPKGEAGRKALLGFFQQGGTYVFFESPKRIIKTIEAIGEISPAAEVCLCNDLSKKFERLYRGKAAEVLGGLLANEHAGKGEYVCVVRAAPLAASDEDCLSIEAQLVDIMAKSGKSAKEAVGELNKSNGKLSRREIYAAALRLGEMLGDAEQ